MIVIGVTGGMASGKSTVARMFAGYGIRHIDADALVHGLMRQDKPTITALAHAFPDAVTKATVDRAALARTIAAHPERLILLEQILHPSVRALEVEAIARARRHRARALILDIPLLFETDAHTLCDVVVAVRAPLAHRKRRAFHRPGMTDAKWQRLLDRQLTDAVRGSLADAEITTSLGKAATQRAVKQLMHQWNI